MGGNTVTPAQRQASIDKGHARRVQERKARRARAIAPATVKVTVPFDSEATLHAVYRAAKAIWEKSGPFNAHARTCYLKGSFEWRRAVAAWGETKTWERVFPILQTDPNVSDDNPKDGLGPLLAAAKEIFSPASSYTENQKVNYLLGNFAWEKAVTNYGFSLACKTVRKVFTEWDGEKRPTWYEGSK